jgi:hypothetical protein
LELVQLLSLRIRKLLNSLLRLRGDVCSGQLKWHQFVTSLALWLSHGKTSSVIFIDIWSIGV